MDMEIFLWALAGGMVVAAKLRNEPGPGWNFLLVPQRNFLVHWLVFLGDGRDAGFAVCRA